MNDYQEIIELGKLDYERFKEADQRCLDAGGCPECKCVAAEQGREHWGHCSKACQVFVDLGIRCGKPITRKMVGPYKTECCSDCAADFVKQGYREVKGDEEKPPLG